MITNTVLNYSGASSANNTTTSSILSLAATYALQQKLVFSLSGLSDLNFSSSNILTATLPEPASVTLLGGILLLTAGAIRRKTRRT